MYLGGIVQPGSILGNVKLRRCGLSDSKQSIRDNPCPLKLIHFPYRWVLADILSSYRERQNHGAWNPKYRSLGINTLLSHETETVEGGWGWDLLMLQIIFFSCSTQVRESMPSSTQTKHSKVKPSTRNLVPSDPINVTYRTSSRNINPIPTDQKRNQE